MAMLLGQAMPLVPIYYLEGTAGSEANMLEGGIPSGAFPAPMSTCQTSFIRMAAASLRPR